MLESCRRFLGFVFVLASGAAVVFCQAAAAMPLEKAAGAGELQQAQPPDRQATGQQGNRLDSEGRLRQLARFKYGKPPEPTVVLKAGEVPQIDFETPVYDFGRVQAGKLVLYDFWFKNIGTGPLEILRVKPTCVCTQAGTYSRIVPPGKRGKISISVDTSRLTGAVTKKVIVDTNEAGQPARIIEMKGHVWEAIGVTPRKVAFGRVPRETLATLPPSQTLTLVNNLKTPVELSNTRSSNAVFSAALRVIQPGKKFELVVSGGPAAESGMNHAMIEIDTNLTEEPVVRVPVSMYVTSPVDVAPAKLTLRQNRPRDVRRSFFVTNHMPSPITISDLRVSNPMLKVSLQETRPGTSFRLLLQVPASYKVPPGGDKITMKTTNPTMPTLTVPIISRDSGTAKR